MFYATKYPVRTRWAISEWAHNPEPTLKNITKELVRDHLIKDMEILHLDKHMVCDRRHVLAILLAKNYSPCRIRNLLGYLDIRQAMTVAQMKQHGYTSHTRRHYENWLAKAGISSLSIESKKTLPALTLLLEATEREENYHIVPSDTSASELEGFDPTDFHRTETLTSRRSIAGPHVRQANRSNTHPRAP